MGTYSALAIYGPVLKHQAISIGTDLIFVALHPFNREIYSYREQFQKTKIHLKTVLSCLRVNNGLSWTNANTEIYMIFSYLFDDK